MSRIINNIATPLFTDLRVMAAAVVLAGAMSACSSDDGTALAVPDSSAATGDAVVFTISTGKEATRAFTYDNKWTMDDQMAICEGSTVYQYKASGNSSSSGDRLAVVPVTVSAQSTYYWSPKTTSRTFCAWYPYSPDKPENTHGSITVAIDQRGTASDTPEDVGSLGQTDYNNYDLLFAPTITATYASGLSSKETVDLTFYHQMCRVVVTVNSTATKGSKPVTDIKLGNGNIAVSGTITTLGETGTDVSGTATEWSVSAGTSTVTMRRQVYDTTENLFTYECVIPPQSLSASATLFQITTTDANNVTKTTNYIPSAMYTDAPVFEAGCQYNYSIALSAAGKVNIATVQVYDWSTENIAGETATVPDAGY